MKRGTLTFLGVLALVALLIFGTAQLFALRMQTGDIYPPYSSLRTDPLGIKALHDSLAEVPGMEVRRSYREPARGQAPVAANFYAGLSREGFDGIGVKESGANLLVDRVSLGSRAVFTFPPENIQRESRSRFGSRATPSGKAGEGRAAKATPQPEKPAKGSSNERRQTAPTTPDPKKDAGKNDASKEKEEEKKKDRHVEVADATLARIWGVKLVAWKGVTDAPFKADAVLQSKSRGLEPVVPWHSALYFEDLVPAWRVIYKCKEKPVVIERPWGDGSVVLASDSFFLSNEALHSAERAPLLLSWLVGPHSVVIFDEEHHHIAENPGVMTLMRKYRLQGVLAGLGLLALLFIWQQAVPFAPKSRAQTPEMDVVSGRSSEEGLITLLRRSVPGPALLETCMAEWRKNGTHNPTERVRLEAAWASLKAAQPKLKSVVEGYRSLLAALRKGKP
jgi:hypothetical protein